MSFTDRPRISERGASMVEYTLLAVLLALASLAGIDALRTSGSAALAAQAAEMSDPPARGASGAPGPTTTTAAPATTTSTTTTTTTTTSTTTTTVPPTTTTAPRATRSTATWGSATSTRDGNRWSASARLTVTDDRGRPVSDAEVTVLIEYRTASGTWRESDEVEGTTSSSGTLQVGSSDLRRTGPQTVGAIRYTVIEVDAERLSWNGDRASVTMSAP